ncbi:hypothetical protein ETJ91_20155 [Bacillus albus]|nr:hypothetical protein ETJ91_20155 [Bacillus albus]RXJ25417.1 hypothetical protein ETJ90_19910 [Bacillus albus]RXJ29470.1 hypothetical protein ETJ76_17920 [Bacillus albus]RXJ38566.1 hypothetical protein ETJ89_19035 [Bacillus albus]RXJ55051.1 hypothetical protein ETJ66_19275 [Bacillus albus]
MEAARSESQGIGALDLEALFASSERVKCPEILAAGTGLSKKRRWLAQKGKALELLTKRRFVPRR